MKISDFIFNYKKYNRGKLERHVVCRVQIYLSKNNKIFTVIIDLPESSSSVTNDIENIIKELIEEGHSNKEHIFLEIDTSGNYHEVKIENNYPKWENIELEKEFSDKDVIEIKESRNLDKKKKDKVDELLYQTDPRRNYREPHDNEYIKRKLKIEQNMKSKEELVEFIQSNPKEQELLKFFKQDLSFFGEVYASLEDEYIVFSEFPLNEKERVDFVVFHGRSRMNVTLIEIKGAKFNLYNQTGYEAENADITKAHNQIKKRLRYIYDNLKEFRKKCHQYREKAEKGELKEPKNLIGAKGKLQVDPEKDIKIEAIIIGGRTVDDLKESSKRHNFEKNSVINTNLDSWDTWIKKLTRK